jgi:hypothetical protein
MATITTTDCSFGDIVIAYNTTFPSNPVSPNNINLKTYFSGKTLYSPGGTGTLIPTSNISTSLFYGKTFGISTPPDPPVFDSSISTMTTLKIMWNEPVNWGSGSPVTRKFWIRLYSDIDSGTAADNPPWDGSTLIQFHENFGGAVGLDNQQITVDYKNPPDNKYWFALCAVTDVGNSSWVAGDTTTEITSEVMTAPTPVPGGGSVVVGSGSGNTTQAADGGDGGNANIWYRILPSSGQLNIRWPYVTGPTNPNNDTNLGGDGTWSGLSYNENWDACGNVVEGKYHLELYDERKSNTPTPTPLFVQDQPGIPGQVSTQINPPNSIGLSGAFLASKTYPQPFFNGIKDYYFYISAENAGPSSSDETELQILHGEIPP